MKRLTELKTDRDVFDYISLFLINQNEKSYSDDLNPTCAYRGGHGMKCAIGCLIEDRFYHETLENNTPYDVSVKNALMLSVPNYKVNEKFLAQMQYVHDEIGIEFWEAQLSRFQFSPEGSFEGVNETV